MRQEGDDQKAAAPRVWPWLLTGIGFLIVIGTSAVLSSSSPSHRVWFQLNAVVPGENVPDWLHSGRRYRGEVVPGGLVKVFEPESERTALVSTSLLTPIKHGHV